MKDSKSVSTKYKFSASEIYVEPLFINVYHSFYIFSRPLYYVPLPRLSNYEIKAGITIHKDFLTYLALVHFKSLKCFHLRTIQIAIMSLHVKAIWHTSLNSFSGQPFSVHSKMYFKDLYCSAAILVHNSSCHHYLHVQQLPHLHIAPHLHVNMSFLFRGTPYSFVLPFLISNS